MKQVVFVPNSFLHLSDSFRATILDEEKQIRQDPTTFDISDKFTRNQSRSVFLTGGGEQWSFQSVISIETENPDFAVSGFCAVAIGLQINHDINSNSNSVSPVLLRQRILIISTELSVNEYTKLISLNHTISSL